MDTPKGSDYAVLYDFWRSSLLLKFPKKGLSIPQNVDNTLFAANAPLKNEFEYLYASIFKNPEVYLKIIEALGTKKIGMSREEIIKTADIINSGVIK